MRWLLLLCVVACGRRPGVTPGSPEDLALYLRSVVGVDEAARSREVASWLLDEPTWQRTVAVTYRDLWLDYAKGFEPAARALVMGLATPGEVTARRHYAGDPRLTLAEARLRWALPVQYPSMVAEVSGSPIDAVFVYDGMHWRALAGLDTVVLERIHRRDPACEALVARAGPRNRCTEVAWVVADAALRSDDAGFAHACRLAAMLCGNGSP